MDIFDILQILVVVIGVVGGLALLMTARTVQQRVKESRHWPTTEGTVRTVAIQEVTEYVSKRLVKKHEVRITYDYLVNGRAYTSDRIIWGYSRFNQQAEAETFAAGYAPGSPVPVYYDPHKPELAVLQPLADESPGRLIASGIGCLVGAGLVALIVLPTISWELPELSLSTPTPMPVIPAKDLLLELAVFPANWEIIDLAEELGVALAFEGEQLAVQGYGIKGAGGVVQSVSRQENIAAARDTFRSWRQSRLESIQPLSKPTYQSPLADEYEARCGIYRGNHHCRALLRYGNYVVDLWFLPRVGVEEVGATLRAMDELMAKRLDIRLPSPTERALLIPKSSPI